MRILVFTEGTLFIGGDVAHLSRQERIQAVQEELERQAEGEPIDFRAEVPAGNAVEKLRTWKRQGAEIMYLTFAHPARRNRRHSLRAQQL